MGPVARRRCKRVSYPGMIWSRCRQPRAAAGPSTSHFAERMNCLPSRNSVSRNKNDSMFYRSWRIQYSPQISSSIIIYCLLRFDQGTLVSSFCIENHGPGATRISFSIASLDSIPFLLLFFLHAVHGTYIPISFTWSSMTVSLLELLCSSYTWSQVSSSGWEPLL